LQNVGVSLPQGANDRFVAIIPEPRVPGFGRSATVAAQSLPMSLIDPKPPAANVRFAEVINA
jgi:hypothetical protein